MLSFFLVHNSHLNPAQHAPPSENVSKQCRPLTRHATIAHVLATFSLLSLFHEHTRSLSRSPNSLPQRGSYRATRCLPRTTTSRTTPFRGPPPVSCRLAVDPYGRFNLSSFCPPLFFGFVGCLVFLCVTVLDFVVFSDFSGGSGGACAGSPGVARDWYRVCAPVSSNTNNVRMIWCVCGERPF